MNWTKLLSWSFWALLLVAAIALVAVVGCHQEAPAVIQIPATPEAALTKIVTTTNWLATLGILVFAAGVYAFFTGNSKADALIAAGVAIGGGVVAFATISQLAEDWTKYAVWILPALLAVAVGIYAWGHYQDTKASADLKVIKDGIKTTAITSVADVKAVLGITAVLILLFFAGIGYAAPLTADLNGDGIVDMQDFAIFADQWLRTVDNNEPNDINVLQDYYDVTYDTYTIVGTTADGGYIWQTFTANKDYTITSVKLPLFRSYMFNPGMVTVAIYAADDSLPTGGVLCWGETDGSTLPTTFTTEWREVDFGQPIQLYTGLQYAVVVSSGDFVDWQMDDTNPYPGGTSGNYINSMWTPWIPASDCLFETYGY